MGGKPQRIFPRENPRNLGGSRTDNPIYTVSFCIIYSGCEAKDCTSQEPNGDKTKKKDSVLLLDVGGKPQRVIPSETHANLCQFISLSLSGQRRSFSFTCRCGRGKKKIIPEKTHTISQGLK